MRPDLKKIPYFAKKSEEELSKIVGKEVFFEEGKLIIKQGELADSFYIIVSGDVRVFTFDPNGKKVVLARLGDGEFFGQKAFSPAVEARRIASCEAIAKTHCFQIERKELHPFFDERLLREEFQHFIEENVQKSHGLPPELIQERKTVEKREVLFEAGSTLDHLFLLLSGAVELRKFDTEKRVEEAITIHPGAFFGEERGVTAVALENSTLGQIPLSHFQSPRSSEEKISFSKYGKALQFTGMLGGVPSWATLIFAPDGGSILCHQAQHLPLLSIERCGSVPTQTLTFHKEGGERKLHLEENRVVGVHDLGYWEDTSDFLQAVVEKRPLLPSELREGVIENRSCEKEIVCTCMRVDRNTLSSAILRGCNTFEKIRRETRASTVCGACRPTILEMLGTSAWIPCKVEAGARHTSNIQTFTFRPLQPCPNSYIPGQHLILRAMIDDLEVRRSYTLTTHPDKPYFEVTIKREEQGLFSRWLYDNVQKDPLMHISGPFGDFLLTGGGTPLLCFAGGIGITPFIAFQRALKGKKRTLVIDYSARNDEEFAFRDELTQGGAVFLRNTAVTGMITKEQIWERVVSLDEPDVYVCGPSGFEELIIETLKEQRYPVEKIHVERFLQAGAPSDAPQMVTL